MTARRPKVHTSAHRGDSSRYRENTLPAVRSAIESGADYVEVDARVTADGAVVVVHDPTFERLWELGQPVAETTLDEVRALGPADSRPPLLAEAAALFAGSDSTLLIDLDDPAAAEPAFRAVAGVAASIAWCGHLESMRTIRRLDEGAEVWQPWADTASPTAEDLAELAPQVINMHYLDASPQLVDDVHALGCAVTLWTVDDEQTMRWARDCGADVVTTNGLSRLQRVLAEARDAAGTAGAAGAAGDVDLDAAAVVARGLGAWAVEFSSSTDPGEIQTKKDGADLVTEVDVAVERHVRQIIGRHFPDHDFVGEEMGGSAHAGVPCWYLDPVDGTANFANRIPWNAFSLALVVDGEPVVAVVADPWRGDLFEAVSGRGATLNGRRLALPSPGAEGDPLQGRIVTTELANQYAWPGMLEMLGALGERSCTLRIMGSGTMTIVGVAAGRGVGAVVGSFGAVDHLAAALIAREAGAIVLGSDGEQTLFPASGGMMAVAPHAADALYAVWRDSVGAAR